MGVRSRAGLHRVGVLVLVAASYYASAWLGLRLALVDDIVTPLWPPTGVAVVATLAFGIRVWPAIGLAAVAVNIGIADRPLTALIIAVGNTAAPLVAAALLSRLGFREDLARVRDAGVLVAVALLSMSISASVGTAAVLVGANGWSAALDTWWVWWVGDTMGLLVVAPVLWAVRGFRRSHLSVARAIEAVALFTGLGAAAFLAARTDTGVLFVVIPVVGWIAWRFQQLGAAPAGLIASVVVTLAAARHEGIFADDPLLQRMAVLQCFNASVAFTSFFFAAAVTERRHVLESLFQRERHIAESLQRSMLPAVLPAGPGVELAAQYIGARDSEIGGDWYDAIPLEHDRLGLVVGDVAGHGIAAASAMGQMRMGLRAHAQDGRGPAVTLRRLNRMVMALHPGVMATVIYAELDPTDGTLRIANAGHPPALVLKADGTAEFLDDRRSVPIGVDAELDIAETEYRLPEGDTLILFTDGLIERRREPIDRGLETLRQAVVAAEGDDVERLSVDIVERMVGGEAFDDVALLMVRPTSLVGAHLVLERPATPEAVGDTRRLLARWLRANGTTEDETYDVLLSLSEAQANAVRHAYRRPGGVIDIEAKVADGEVTLVLRDHGRWVEPKDAPTGESGWGLGVIRALMDTELRRSPAGTEVRMRRVLGAASSGLRST